MEAEQPILDLTEDQETEDIIPASNPNSYMDLEMGLKMDFGVFDLGLGF